jgi:hypothetical protein
VQHNQMAPGNYPALRHLLSPLAALDSTQQGVLIPDPEYFALPWHALLDLAAGPAANRRVDIHSSMTSAFYAFQKRKLPGVRMYLAGDRDLGGLFTDSSTNRSHR